MRDGIGDGNRVQGLTTSSLGIPNLDFQPILSISKFYSIATWNPWHCSTKIWMSTELAENQDLGPLGYPHHRGVLGFCRIFHANLKIDQGLRDLGPTFVTTSVSGDKVGVKVLLSLRASIYGYGFLWRI